MQHFLDLLGNDSITLPDTPQVSATLTAESSLPADTNIGVVTTGVDQTLADTDEAGVKVITKEKEELDKLDTARGWQTAALVSEGIAAIAHIIPTVNAHGTPLGVGVAASWGGTQLGNAFSAGGKVLDFITGVFVRPLSARELASAAESGDVDDARIVAPSRW